MKVKLRERPERVFDLDIIDLTKRPIQLRISGRLMDIEEADRKFDLRPAFAALLDRYTQDPEAVQEDKPSGLGKLIKKDPKQ